jgi:hypothetical protein
VRIKQYAGPRGQPVLHRTQGTEWILQEQDDRWDYMGPRGHMGLNTPRGQTGLDGINRTEGLDRVKSEEKAFKTVRRDRIKQ